MRPIVHSFPPLRLGPDTRGTELVWPVGVEDNSAMLDSLPAARAGQSQDELLDLLSVLADGWDESGEEESVDRFLHLLGARSQVLP